MSFQKSEQFGRKLTEFKFILCKFVVNVCILAYFFLICFNHAINKEDRLSLPWGMAYNIGTYYSLRIYVGQQWLLDHFVS
jgi:hypothetical protein